MRDIRLSGRNPGSHHKDRTDDRIGEQGYLLFLSGVLILIIVALLSSYAFTIKRDGDYKANYTAGERFAVLVAAAHFYAQQQVYDPPGTSINGNCNLLTDMNLPGGAAIPVIPGATLSMEICGADEAPLNSTTTHGPTGVAAASAYVHLSIRSTGAYTRPPSDTIAFLAGAATGGTERVGIYGTNAGGTCDGIANSAVMRWGPDPSACLTNALIGALGFTDVQPGDIIVPAWETALAQNKQQVVYRYKQPERPDANTMNHDLLFDPSTLGPGATDCTDDAQNCMVGVKDLTTKDVKIAIPAGAPPGTTSTTNLNTMQVRLNSPTTITGAMVVNDNPGAPGTQPLRVYDQNGAANVMTVTGPVILSTNGAPATVSVGGNMLATGVVVTTVTDPVETNLVGKVALPDSTTITLNGNAATRKMAIEKVDPLGIITDVSMTNGAKRFNTLGNLGAVGGTQQYSGIGGANMDVFAASMNTNGTAYIRNAADNLDWSVGSIDLKDTTNDPTKKLTLQSIIVNQDCIGRACPDSINEAPPGGAF